MTETTTAKDHMERLIERSSLGSAEAKAVRESVPPEVGSAIITAARHMARADAAEAERDALLDALDRVEALADEWEGRARLASIQAATERSRRAAARERAQQAMCRVWLDARADLRAALGDVGLTASDQADDEEPMP